MVIVVLLYTLKERRVLRIIEIIESNKAIKKILKDCPYDILNKWEFKEYSKEQVICYQDMQYEYFYIIIEGYANICLTAENGKKYSQAIYKRGDYFGELEIFDNKPYICSIEALTDMQIIRINKEYFLKWISKDQHFSLHITRTLCDSFYKLSQLSGENTLYSLKYRVCNYLLYKLDSGIKSNMGIEIKVDKEQLSERFAVTSRSINRVFQQLKESKVIEVSNNFICIIDIKRLSEEEKVSRNE